MENELAPIDEIALLDRHARHHTDDAAVVSQDSPVSATVDVAAPSEPIVAPPAEVMTEQQAPEPLADSSVASAAPNHLDSAKIIEVSRGDLADVNETATDTEEMTETAPPEEALEDEGGDFGIILEQYLDKIRDFAPGEIVEAEIVDVKRAYVLVDVGDKAEGVIDIDEFEDAQGEIQIVVGDRISVQILGRESETGQIRMSHRRAVIALAWERIGESVRRHAPISGRIVQVVKGGLMVDIGVPAFMPASQIDKARVADLADWLNRDIEAYVLDVDHERKRVVLSRRQLVLEDEQRKRQRILASLEPGQERVVRIKRVLDFGAFADLGGIDGLIPREEVSWDRGADPNQYLKEGRDLKVTVVNVDRETGRITLSRKRSRPDPWAKIEQKYAVGNIVKGKVSGLADFGAFVSLEEGVQGMIHSSDLSWASGFKKPQDYLNVGDTVRVAVLEVVKDRRRMSLGLKQVTKDPWLEVEEKFPPQTVVKGNVSAITKYGAFVRLNEYVEGLIHISDMTWEKKPKSPSHYVQAGQEIEVVVLKLDPQRRRVSLGFKQLAKSPFEKFVEAHRVGSVVEGRTMSVTPYGVFVQLAPEVEGLIHISQLDDQHVEKAGDVAKVGQKIEAKIIKIDKQNEKISLSRKAYLKEEQRRMVAAYTEQTSASIGPNMGEMLRALNIRPVDSDRE
ncbi:30S ribosomal protein S1 [Candidatus Sumerlaeota bacterium]|nr:30S ribosomal protein S1 [Candidatus Sumerlaeota bacterium]